MNVMAKAHKQTKAVIAAMSPEGQAQVKAERLYARFFALNLKQAHKEFKAMQTNEITGFDTNRLNVPNQLAYSFNGKTRSAEVYKTEGGLYVMEFYKGRLQLNAKCSTNEQAKAEAQRWMSFDK